MIKDDKILKILIFDDSWNDIFKSIFLHFNYHLDITTDIEKAKRQIKDYDGAIINLCLSNQLSADKSNSSEMLLSYIKSKCPFLPRIVVTGKQENRVRSLIKEFGVYNVFSKRDIHTIDLKKEMRDAIKDCNRKVKKVFISSATEDYEMAKKLYYDLKQPGISPWLAPVDILGGEEWKQKITLMIEKSDYFLTLLSSESCLKRGFYQKEQIIALEVRDTCPENKIFIIPVRIDSCEIPEKLKQFHCVDLFPSYDKGLQKILESLNS